MASEQTSKASPNETPTKQTAKKPQKKDLKHRKEDFELGELLGDGAFAKVVEGIIINEKSPQFGAKYAIKVMDKRHIMKNNKIKYVTIEKKVFLATAAHPFICHLHFTFQDSYSLFMVLDLCNDAELSYEIWKYMGLTQQLTCFYVSEVISCLEYMHSKGIYHRDIKPENILIHNDKHIRLTDFGTAKITQNNPEIDTEVTEHKENPYGQGYDKKGSFVGTAQYVPPELLGNDGDIDIQWDGMDFWALGILIYQCLLNTTPFNAANEYLTFKKIELHNYQIPDTISDTAKAIIDAFLTQNVKQRLGMNGYQDIKQHKFFESVESWDWKDMRQVIPPKYPATPKLSPVHDEDAKKKLRGSLYTDGLDENATPMDIVPAPIMDTQPSVSIATLEMNEVLYKKWQRFLNLNEVIEMGSSVEKSKYFGMGAEKSVMLLTSNKRVLLIDTSKMVLRKNGDIPRSSIVDCNVIDKETFELRFVKSKMKFKCSGPKAEKWKKAFDRIC